MISRETYKVFSHYARTYYAMRARLANLGVPPWKRN